MRTKLCALILAAGGLVVMAGAQAPLLQVAPNPSGPRHQQLMLRNRYRAAATEWVLRTCPPNAISEGLYCGGGAVRHHWALPAYGRNQLIPAGGERAIAGSVDSGFVDVAVIYADGTTAGDPTIVKDLLAARQRTVDDLRTVIPMLKAAAANPAENYTALEATLSDRNQAYRTAVETDYHSLGGVGQAPTYADRVCASLVQGLSARLKKGLSEPQMARYLATQVKFFTGFEQQMLASKPALH